MEKQYRTSGKKYTQRKKNIESGKKVGEKHLKKKKQGKRIQRQ